MSSSRSEGHPHLCPLSTSTHGTTPFSQRPLESTVELRDAEFLHWLAARGFAMEDINEQREDVVPPGGAVHAAAFEGSARHCRWLASHGANLSLVSSSTGQTPFHCAMQRGSFAVCAFLLKHGCGGDLEVAAKNGMRPGDYAEHLGHITLLRWLQTLKRGEDHSASEATNPCQSPSERELNPREDYWHLTAVPPPTKAELAAIQKQQERRVAMSRAGLDSDSFQGFTKKPAGRGGCS